MSEKSCYDCKEAFQRLDDFLDRELTVAEMELVRQHLEKCEMCASEFRFEGDVLTSLREKLSRIDLPSDLMARIRAVIEGA